MGFHERFQSSSGPLFSSQQIHRNPVPFLLRKVLVLIVVIPAAAIIKALTRSSSGPLFPFSGGLRFLTKTTQDPKETTFIPRSLGVLEISQSL